ncbi:MAG: aldehyde dehydrogenase family protein [Oligoflexales bacterium]|nr:aldehyde dehydrogenase family protein [Oligoflexales bacterium]
MKVSKTIKLYIGGAFVRSESGRTVALDGSGSASPRVCLASRKDFRNSVDAAKKGFAAWQKMTPFNRSQILYRMAEMLEGKRHEFQAIMPDAEKAGSQLDEAIDLFVYYAGFCDKFQQLSSSINPVNGPYQHTSTPEALGVCSLVTAADTSFADLCGCIAALMAGGNSVVCLLGPSLSPLLGVLAEVLQTSGLPGGCVNLLSGKIDELHEVIAGHHEVRAVACLEKDQASTVKMRELAAGNLKQVLPYLPARSIENILNYVDYKSVWHPQGC